MPGYRRLNLYKVKYETKNRKMVRRLSRCFIKLKSEVEKRKIQKTINREFGKDMPILEEKVRQRIFDSCIKYINSCKMV